MKLNIIILIMFISLIQAKGQNSQRAVESCNNFAFALYHQTVGENANQNFVFSPLSLNLALRMVSAGARNNTLNQLQKVVFANEDPLFVHSNIKELLTEYTVDSSSKTGLSYSNSLWIQNDYSVLPEFSQIIGNLYYAQFGEADFKSTLNREKARNEINRWTMDKTNGQIKSILNEKSLNNNTRLVLVNALYFQNSWKYPFNQAKTQNMEFTSFDGKKHQHQFMQLENSIGYHKNNQFHTIVLPYIDNRYSMLIIMPETERFEMTEKQLSAQAIDTLFQQLNPVYMQLAMPKFKAEFNAEFDTALKAMGIEDAFGLNADFSGITNNLELYISKVIHKSFIELSEQGTKAGSATAVTMSRKMAVTNPLIITVNKPFIYAIIDTQTGLILFIGRVITL